MRILKVLLWQKGQHKTTNPAVWRLSQQRPLPQQVFAMLLKTKVSTAAAAASSCVFDIMNSSSSSSTDVVHTASPLAGSPNDADVTDWSWPTIPIPPSVQPYPKAPESKETIMRRKTGKSWIPTATPEKDQTVAEHTERLKTMRWGESLSERKM